MARKFELVQRVELIKEIADDRSVLHLGCTNYPFTKEALDNDMLLHDQLGKNARELYGFDFDREGIDILEGSGTKNLFQADLEKLENVKLNKTFDVIIAGEIIEHLLNPGLFLEGIQRFMHSGTELVITTINAYCALRFVLYGLRGNGGENEPVHPDHVTYFSYRTLKLMVEKSGLHINRFYFYDIGSDHRKFNPWYYNLANDLAVKVSPQLSDGIIAICGLEKE